MYLMFSMNSPVSFYNDLWVKCYYDAYITVDQIEERKWLPETQGLIDGRVKPQTQATWHQRSLLQVCMGRDQFSELECS